MKMMEDHRDELVVIVAGLLRADGAVPRLEPRSGFPLHAHRSSSPTTPSTSWSRSPRICARKHYYELTDDAVEAVTTYFERIPKNATFGNGRVARKLFEAMINNQASRLAAAPASTETQLNRLTAADVEPELATLAELPVEQTAQPNAATDPRGAVAASRSWARIAGLVGAPSVREAVADTVLELCELHGRRRAYGRVGNVVIAGRPGTGRTEFARLYAMVLSELNLVPVGHQVRVSTRDELAPQWGGQSGLWSGRRCRTRRAGFLLSRSPVMTRVSSRRALVEQIRADPGGPVVVLVGEPADVAVLRSAVPGIAEAFGREWTVPLYSAPELGEIAVRHLLRRGHLVPEDVRSAAIVDLAANLPEPTVRAAHQFSYALTRTAASRTLALADLTGSAPASMFGGLSAVG